MNLLGRVGLEGGRSKENGCKGIKCADVYSAAALCSSCSFCVAKGA